MGSFEELAAVLPESMCSGSRSSSLPADPLKIPEEATNCALFKEGFVLPPQQEISEKVCEEVVKGCDNGLKEELGNAEEISCTEEIDSTTVVASEVNEGLFPHLDNGSGTEIDGREVDNADKQAEENIISKDDDGTVVLEEKVGFIEGADLNSIGLELSSVNVANKNESSQIGETNACTGELKSEKQIMPEVALAKSTKERERKPKYSDLIVFTRRNPRRSASHLESDLNIDRLTRISNRSRKSRKEKEIFDPTLLVRMIQDPNLTTKKRKPLSRRDKVTQWGKNDNLSEIIDQSLQFCKSKKEREAEKKRHLKQNGVLERDMDSTLTHEISSGDQTVRRVTNGRDTADPGSSPDSVVYNPLSCEANAVELQQKKLTKEKKKKKNKGGNVRSNKRGEKGLYWFQIGEKGKKISDMKTEEKGKNLSAPGVTRKEMGNVSDPYNGVTIALLTEFSSMDGTQQPLNREGYLAQLLPAAKPIAPVAPLSIPEEASGTVPVPVPVPTHSVPVPTNPKHIPLNIPTTNSVNESEKSLQQADAFKPAFNKPRVAWVSCDECGKWRCIPAELADVIDETNCRWTCKDNADKAFVNCSIPQEKSNAEINAELELSDASGDERQSLQGSKIGDVKHNMKPHSTKSAKKALGHAPYTPLKTNSFLHRHRRSQTIDEIMVCNCIPPKNGGMGCRSQCLNRMLSIECIKGMCPCGDLCSNQQFQRRNYAKLMSLRCGKKGYGLQLLEDVPAGRFLIEYVGEVLDMATYEARQKEYASRGQKHFYFMTLNGGEVIDACAKGNLGRFINHSCDPNCRTEKWIVNGEVCIGLFAVRDIKKGEELTFDYNYVRVVGAAAKKCFCGAAICRGYIGGDPSSTDLIVQEDSDEEEYFDEPVTAKQPNNTLKKHRQPNNNKSHEINDDTVVRSSDTVEVHKGFKPDNMPIDNSQGIVSQSNNTHPENNNSSESKIGKKMRHKAHGDINITKPENPHDKDTSSSIAASSYGLLELHLSRVNSLVDYKTDGADCSSSEPPPGFSLPIHSSNDNNNRESDDVSTPVLSYHSTEEEQVPADDTNTNNIWESSSSDDYEHLKLPNEDNNNTPWEEDAPPRTPVHVTRFLSNRVHSRRLGHKFISYSDPSASDNAPTEHVDMYMKNIDEDHPASYQEGREMAHDTAARDFEGVEEKLNKLLDKGGSISRRKHATKGYLKLLIVTAAAGDTGTSQRLRDLSLILDALLKTSNNYVLMDIMKTNGLQMLHTILKQNRDDFNRIPVIRKLLKVLGHLADRGILTLEQMNQGPPRPGMESFRESIYKLTKHNDKQVHYHARGFFNKYMPKSMRVHDSFQHTYNPPKSKRKSRWDIPSDINDINSHDHNHDPNFPNSYNSQPQQHTERPFKRPCSYNNNLGEDNDYDDAPPGFETERPPPGFGSNVLQPELGFGMDSAPVHVALGYKQEMYIPNVSVSYGIPAMTAKDLGVFAQSGERVFWGIAPGIPFKPFPPLPRNNTNGSGDDGNDGSGYCSSRARKHWYHPNSKNQRRFSRPYNNNNYYYYYPRNSSSNSNSQRSCKDWPKWPRESR